MLELRKPEIMNIEQDILEYVKNEETLGLGIPYLGILFFNILDHSNEKL